MTIRNYLDNNADFCDQINCGMLMQQLTACWIIFLNICTFLKKKFINAFLIAIFLKDQEFKVLKGRVYAIVYPSRKFQG